MLVSTIFMWVAIAAGFIIALPSLWLCGQALWPVAAEKRAQVAASGNIKTLLAGAVPLIIAITLLSRIGKAGLAGVIPLTVILLWGFASADGLATFVGRKIWPYLHDSKPWKQTMRGGFVLVGAALLPLVGWILVLPLIAVMGWGTSVRSWFVKSGATGPVAAQTV
jgi:hypothetical protein